jgi:hypothetical protein
MKASNRTYRKPSVLDRGIVELVTKDSNGRSDPESFGETFCWGYPPVLSGKTQRPTKPEEDR